MVLSRKSVIAKASDLNRICHIQKPVDVADGQGGSTRTWADVPGLERVPVLFKTWSPSEEFRAQQLYPGVHLRCVMRYRKSVNITSAMRLVYGTKIYFIRGVANYDEGNQAIQLYLEETQSAGSNH